MSRGCLRSGGYTAMQPCNRHVMYPAHLPPLLTVTLPLIADYSAFHRGAVAAAATTTTYYDDGDGCGSIRVPYPIDLSFLFP